MANPDLLLYATHVVFWLSFAVAGKVAEARFAAPTAAPAAAAAPAAGAPATAPYSRALLGLHMGAFGVMYFGVANAVLPMRVTEWLPGQRWVGVAVMAGGAGLMAWARVWFQSWRFRAQLDAGHQLATGGPFAWVRHPIYGGLNLLAVGTAVWAPSIFTVAGAVLMVIGSDLRGRAEEGVLTATFGAAYADYMRRTARFLPGVY